MSFWWRFFAQHLLLSPLTDFLIPTWFKYFTHTTLDIYWDLPKLCPSLRLYDLRFKNGKYDVQDNNLAMLDVQEGAVHLFMYTSIVKHSHLIFFLTVVNLYAVPVSTTIIQKSCHCWCNSDYHFVYVCFNLCHCTTKTPLATKQKLSLDLIRCKVIFWVFSSRKKCIL